MFEAIIPSSEDYKAPALFSREIVVFPHMEVVLTVGEATNIATLEQALRERHIIAFIPHDDPKASSSQSILDTIGTLARVRHSIPVHDGARQVWIKGLRRIQLKEVINEPTYTRIRFAKVNELKDATQERSSLMRKVLERIDEFLKLIPGIPIEIVNLLKSAETSGKLADLCAYSPDFTLEERLDLLGTLNPEERLKKVSTLFERQLNILRKAAEVKPIPECETCQGLAEKAFELDPNQRWEVAEAFLHHVIREHTGELLALLIEKYGPVFMKMRALR